MDTTTLAGSRPGVAGRVWVGPVGSGKTSALIEWVHRLVDEGADAADILFLASTPSAVAAARERLADAGVAGATVSTLSDFLVARLGRPEIRELTGRVPRVLEDFEERILDEDMKVTGVKPKRLKEMLKFFYRTWTELGDESDDFIVEPEERVVDAALREHLRCREAMLRPELSNVAFKLLRDHPDTRELIGAPHVIVDDFQNLNRASQLVAEQMAGASFAVAGNPDEQVATDEPYPWRAGLDEVAARYGAEAVRELDAPLAMPGDVASVVNHLAARPAFAGYRLSLGACAQAPAMQCVKWTYPNDEFRGIAAYIADRLAAEPALRPREFFVAVPNALWARALARVLDARGIAADVVASAHRLSGDPRRSDRNGGLRAFAALNLAAAPTDGAAWRSWCGFDNYLTNSDAWGGLQAFAEKRELTLYDALALADQLEDEPFLRAHALVERWRAGQKLIAANVGRKGFGLLQAIGADGLPEFEETARALVGDEDAAAVFALQRANVTDPALPDDPHVLHVASYGALCGVEYDNIFAIAAVDGFMPRRDAFEVISTEEDRERIMNEERRLFCNSVSKASKRLVVSYFSKAPLELAERAKMQVVRVKAEGNGRVASVRPTAFLAEAGNAAPVTTGGQALLAQHGLN